MKNFKKVISSVIALAISVSSFAAVNAASFSDVADTASYAEAVAVLKALGVVTGYEENGAFTFKPEDTITRAEAATMIVGALNMKEEASNSSATCQFADVNEKASWAAGFVNVGVSEGFISGRNENEFDPQANVTYAEMCVMTTKLTGYAEYATSNIKEGDPWYKCYTDMAASAGLNKGVSVPLTSALSRGHVAQMIYNALVTPKLGIETYSFTGNEYAPLDGSKDGREFKTLLSDKFNGYVVTATVTQTAKSNTNLEKGQAKLEITKAANWNKNVIKSTDKPVAVDGGVDVIGIDNIENMLFQSGTAVLLIDELDEVDMVYFNPNTKFDTKEFDAADYAMQGGRGTGKKFSELVTAKKPSIQFGASTLVKVQPAAVGDDDLPTEVYVNGNLFIADLAADADADAKLDKFLGNAQGKITFVKASNDIDAFNKIFIDYYLVGEVTNVAYKSEKTTVRVKVENDYAADTSIFPAKDTYEITISDEAVAEDECDIMVSKNGTAIELKEIAKGDVIAFALNLDEISGSDITDPAYIDVFVTDETVKGMVLDYDDEEGTYTIGENVYQYVGYNYSDSVDSELKVSETYELMLDPFGRIINEGKTVATTDKFAIVEKYNDDLDKVTLLLADGTTAAYEIHGSSALKAADVYEALKGTEGVGSVSTPTTEVQKRVVKYTVSNGLVKLNGWATGTELSKKEYNATTSKLGAVTVTDGVSFVDASDYVTAFENDKSHKITDFVKFDASELRANTDYSAYAFKSGDLFSFVIITAVGTTFTEESRFAVVVKKPATMLHKDESVTGAKALYKGQEITLYWVADAEHSNGDKVEAGDAFFYTTDSDGFVKESYKIYDKNGKNTIKEGFVDEIASDDIDGDDWDFNSFKDSVKDIKLVAGVVTEVKNNSITFGLINDVLDDNGDPMYEGVDTLIDGNLYDDDEGLRGMYTFGIAEGCNAYEFDAAKEGGKEEDKYSNTEGSSINESSLLDFEFEGEKIDYVYQTAGAPAVNYAVAMIVDGDVVCIYNIAK